MPIEVSCPSCFREFRVKDDSGRRQFRCGDCGALVTVPSDDDRKSAAGEFELPASPDFNEPAVREATASIPRQTPDSHNPYRGAELALPPGVALMITGSVSLMIALGNAVFFLVAILADSGDHPRGDPPPEAIAVLAVITAFQVLVGGTVAGLTFAGGNSLRKCGSYGLAMTGAIVAISSVIFGCPCTPFGFAGMGMACLNLPVGIWALVMLCNPDVKAAFNRPPIDEPASAQAQ